MKKRWIGITLAVLLLTNGMTFYLAKRETVFGNDLSPQEAIKMQYLKTFIKKNYLRKVDEKKFYTGQLKGIVASLEDPYSEYYTKKEMQDLMDFTQASFYGVGMVLAPGDDDLITVVSAIKDSPADKAGITTGDKIIKVNSKDYRGENLSQAVEAMKGKEDTKVDLQILKKDEGVKTLTLVRKKISLDTVISQKLEGNLAYIGIQQFSDHTAEEFSNHVKKVVDENTKGLILDLRGNPGGVMDGATEIADQLLGKGLIVSAKDREGKIVDKVESDEKALDLPMVVLMNKGSASASEILAGALKDHKRATLVGDQSYGKGVIQIVKTFPGGDGIKLTVAEYFTPNGVSIDKKGIAPDVKVDLDPNAKGIGLNFYKEDKQLQKAVDLLKDKN